MPNWCEGNIRLRGKPAAILNFIKNEIMCSGYRKFPDGLEIVPAEVEVSYGSVIVKKPESMQGTNFCKLYIKGTRRNFLDDFEVYLDDEGEKTTTVCIDGLAAAWGFEPEPYLEKARKYGIDIRIVGFERGMQFVQDVTIVNGEIVENSELRYDDWMWECPMPNLGG